MTTTDPTPITATGPTTPTTATDPTDANGPSGPAGLAGVWGVLRDLAAPGGGDLSIDVEDGRIVVAALHWPPAALAGLLLAVGADPAPTATYPVPLHHHDHHDRDDHDGGDQGEDGEGLVGRTFVAGDRVRVLWIGEPTDQHDQHAQGDQGDRGDRDEFASVYDEDNEEDDYWRDYCAEHEDCDEEEDEDCDGCAECDEHDVDEDDDEDGEGDGGDRGAWSVSSYVVAAASGVLGSGVAL